MRRSLLQVYLKNSREAALFYQEAFRTSLTNVHEDDDGQYIHAELNLFGQVLAISEAKFDLKTGNQMQFCLQFTKDEVKIVENAYEILKKDAKIDHPLGQIFYSPLMFSLIDQYGVNWCMFVT
jgi:PhnB protein